MSEMRAILEETCAKLFAQFEEPALLRRVEAGEWPPEIWAGISEMGLDQIFSGGSDDPWRDACVVIKACGRHVLPAPLPETLMAGAVLADSDMEQPEGPLTVGALISDSELKFSGDRASETFGAVPWARFAKSVVVDGIAGPVILPIAETRLGLSQAISREPRDDVEFEFACEAAQAQASPAQTFANLMATFESRHRRPRLLALAALMRAAQIAGCIEAVLAMTVSYARERQQFGKPIGSFQAIQHQLAILAGHSAAASRAVNSAFDRIAESSADYEVLMNEAAVAKIRCGEAAGAAASIAHQTHGAIGFTDEHRLHYYTRRLWSWRSEFGSEAYWSGVLGRRVAAAGADGFWPMVTAAG